MPALCIASRVRRREERHTQAVHPQRAIIPTARRRGEEEERGAGRQGGESVIRWCDEGGGGRE
jgi:hypothetical protein